MNTVKPPATGHRKDSALEAPTPARIAAREAKALFKPTLVKGVGPGELITVTPSMFVRLDVDPSYQRGETTMVNEIIRALQAGGHVLDPVTLCHRKGSETLWIVDGHQRVSAFQHLKMPFTAMLHKSEDSEAEHHFFVALNSKRAVNPNVICKAWTGPSGSLMRRSNESPEHPLYDRLNFSQAQNDTRISASSLARGMLCVTGTTRSSGRIDTILSKIDTSMSKQMAKARVEHYLRLLGQVCPQGFLPGMVLRALGVVAHERWLTEIKMPNRKVIDKLKAKPWSGELLVQKYFSVLLDTVRKAWRV